jgi:hypothetical protein
MALQAAGTRTHTFRFERAIESRNAVGEVVQGSWTKLARRRGSIKQVSYGESNERKQTIGQSSFEIIVPFVDGLDGTCRVVWESGGNRILFPTSVVADERDEHTIEASEKTA